MNTSQSDSPVIVPEDVAGEVPMILTTDGALIPLSAFEPPKPDRAYIVYTDNNGEMQRVRRTTYQRKDA